jgi:hypothetical protein
MSPKRLIYTAAVGVTLAAFASPATAGAQDLRSPDARAGGQAVSAGQDLRSPDARSVLAPQSASIGADLRSPDTRDAGQGRGTFSAPDVMVVKVHEPAPAPVSSADGIDWSDAGIGAGVLLGLAALAFGGVFAVAHRRRTATPV